MWLLGGSVVFGLLRPGYGLTHAISELGQQGSDNAVAWNVVGFGGVALLYMIYSVPIGAAFGRSWFYWMTIIQALGTAASGLFSCDPGCPPVMVTWQGWGHTVAGLTYFATLTLIPFAAWRTFRSRSNWRGLSRFSMVIGGVLVGLFLVGPLFGAELVGLWQRTTLLVAGTWQVIVALRLYKALRLTQLGRVAAVDA